MVSSFKELTTSVFMKNYLLHISHIFAVVCMTVTVLCTLSCSKNEDFTTDRSATLSFSEDTIKFDTVFTTIGSSTEQLMIYNRNSNGVRLKNVTLQNGATSGFRLNLDGQFGTTFNDIELYGNDSLFCFVEVTVNTQNSNDPVLIKDEIVFTLESGTQQRIPLQVYGQDAVILHNPTITANTTYTDVLPYLIYGPLTINEGVTLTLDPGARLYFHADGSINCNGTLYADGTSKEILLRGDRLDKMFWYLPYDRLDNQWQGITLGETSKDNYLKNVNIHSGNYGIKAQGNGTETNKLTFHSSVIHNVGGAGLSLNNCSATIGNSQISNCRGNCVEITGGSYTFEFCTIAQFCPWISTRGNAIRFSNGTGSNDYVALSQLNITDCIITGYAKDEVFGIAVKDVTDAVFNFKFTNCLLDTDEPSSYVENFVNCTYQTTDQTTNFRTIDTKNFIYDFQLNETSIARGKGTADGDILTRYPTDRLGKTRDASSIDLGCYQF